MNAAPQTFTAFLLTRQWRDTPDGIELDYWVSSDQGPLRLRLTRQQAVCFIGRETPLEPGRMRGLPAGRKPLDLTALNGEAVDALYFNRQGDLQRLRDLARERGVMLFESDIRASDRYLMERFITAPMAIQGQPLRRPGHLELIDPQIKAADHTPRLSYLSLDIETDGAGGEILSIAYCGQGHEAVLMQGHPDDWGGAPGVEWHPDERHLLLGFLERFSARDPDLILGWNLINFDLDQLERRCRRHRVPFTLGRGGGQARILQPQQPGQPRIASIPGRVALDGIDNLRAAFWSFESFALGEVAHELLGRGKLIEASGGQKIAEIRRLFREDRPALAAYNLEDCRLVEAIFDRTDLLNFIIQRSLMTGLPLGRQGGSVAAFDNLYLPHLHRAAAVALDVGAHTHDVSSPGGYVMDSRPGLYDNVLVLDFKSLYPSIIRTFMIDPLGMARPGDDPIPGFLGARFSRTGSILPGIITRLWQQRDAAKRDRNAALAQAIKIIMNSFYGVLGSSGCRFYDPRLASSITRRGHQIIQQSRDWIEEQGYPVIYGDTDSLFVLLGPGPSEQQAGANGKQLAKGLNQWWKERLHREFKVASALEIEFETHFIRFVMPTIRGAQTGSKKRYAGYIRNRSGALELKFKGLESVRSDWTPLAREFQRELYRLVFFDLPYRDYIRQTVEQLKRGELDPQLVYRKRLRRPLEEYQRNIPPHVQAARKLGRQARWISYLITSNGPEPLQDRHSPIDYQHYIDRQLAPVADAILHFVDDRFERIAADQMGLFDDL
ncbi:MAG: DNA polymerase II [gamma proteobacterium symbiont of Phacoides pectinatus]